jgi:5-bromo-4-chloroindolyl phosphate hydrolysis protein
MQKYAIGPGGIYMIEKRIKSALPVYGIGIAFLIGGIFFPPYKLVNLAICAVISVVSYFALSKVFPGTVKYERAPAKPSDTGNKELDQMILQGRNNLNRLEDLGEGLRSDIMGQQIEELCLYGRKIFDFIEKNTAQGRSVKSFMDYYLPTTVSLVENYMVLKNQGIKGENITSSLEKIEGIMETIVKAFKTQLDNLFQDKAMDIATEVNVMKRLIESEGLTDTINFVDPKKAGGKNA